MASEATPWKSLHPASVVVNLLPRTWGVIRSMWPLLLVMFYGGSANGESLVDVALLMFFLFMTVGGTIVHWLTLRYRVHEGRLEVQSGLLNRQMRVIAPDRIQNIETVQNVFHRISGLVEVRIETASGTEVEGLLSALSVQDAQALTDALEAARQGALSTRQDTEEAAPVVVENDLRDLFRFGVTATRMGAALVVVGVLYEVSMRVGDVEEAITSLGLVGYFASFIAVITGTWLVGTARAMAAHYGFKLVQRSASLVATEGLFTKRRVELPVGKVQVVTVSEPLLRRLAGFGTIHIETAAAREGGGGTQQAEAVVPVVDREALYQVVAAAVPSLDVDLAHVTLRPPAKMALLRAFIASGWQAGLVAAGMSWWFWPGGLVALLLIPAALVAAWLDYRYQGWLVTDAVIISREGFLNRQTRIVARGKLQSTQVSQGPFLRRYGLGRLGLRVAGSAVALPILSWDEACAVQQALLRS